MVIGGLGGGIIEKKLEGKEADFTLAEPNAENQFKRSRQKLNSEPQTGNILLHILKLMTDRA